MKISKVQAIYFSPTGGTKKLVLKFAGSLGAALGVPVEETRLALPEARRAEYNFASDELVILACPVYAGRVPNKIEPDLRRILHFDSSPAIAISTFGNRSFGTAPYELADILSSCGARPYAAGAFVTRHAFTDKVARRRPDREDKAELESFALKAAELVSSADSAEELKCISGEIGEYYRPLKEDGTPAVFLKAKPRTRTEDCYYCGHCVRSCPMGSIEADCVTVSGICIKCQACVHGCHAHAKYFDDPQLISHVAALEKTEAAPKENAFFLD